jgi:hypothetical protein
VLEPERPSVARRLAPAVTVVALGLAASAAVERWSRRWRGTDVECRMDLPGDDLVPRPDARITRAVTIDAPPAAVWPWLVQIGADRGGFYSHDLLEDLLGLGIHSADAVVAAWQDRSVGDLVLANRTGTAGWVVADVVAERALVLELADMATSRSVNGSDRAPLQFVWSFVLEPLPGGRTRLLVRERMRCRRRAMRIAIAPVELVSLLMTARMLRGIAERSERAVLQ